MKPAGGCSDGKVASFGARNRTSWSVMAFLIAHGESTSAQQSPLRRVSLSQRFKSRYFLKNEASASHTATRKSGDSGLKSVTAPTESPKSAAQYSGVLSQLAFRRLRGDFSSMQLPAS